MPHHLQKTIVYWKTSAAQDFKAAQSLFAKRLYPHCLFFCHLTLEKLLKGLVVQHTGKQAPYIHDLRRLAELARLACDDATHEILDEMSYFNVAGRYPEEKIAFFTRYNKKVFAQKYLTITRRLILWLEKEYQKK